MEQLEEVVLKGNKIKDPSNIGRAMRVIKPLKSLDLSHNKISTITGLNNLQDLKTLNLTTLTQIEIRVFF